MAKNKKRIKTMDDLYNAFGSYSEIAKHCKKNNGDPITPRGVCRWYKEGCLPRTESTGESNYLEQLQKADPRIDVDAFLALRSKAA